MAMSRISANSSGYSSPVPLRTQYQENAYVYRAKRAGKLAHYASWMPACAGMTTKKRLGAQLFERGAHVFRHGDWAVRHAVAADVHEVPLCGCGRLVVAENADLEAHAARSQVRDAK